MGIFKGGALRLFQVFLYLLAFCCSAIVIGIYSYFLAVESDRNAPIPKWEQAVEGISGAAVVYTVLAFFLTCCLGGVTFFAVIGLFLDICFCGGMIAIAVLTRSGASSCKGFVHTPIGDGNADAHHGFQGDIVYKITYGLACRMNTAVFAVAIIGAFIFAITALMQIALRRNHQKEKRFGPGPNNNYTSGSGSRRRWGRKNKGGAARDTEMGATATTGGLAAPGVDNRASHETGYTGTTVGGHNAANADKVEQPGYTHAGYHTQPTGTGVNPYGYGNTGPTGTATNY